MYKEAVCLFYSNLSFPSISEGTKPILTSHLLDVHIQLSVSFICDILNLPNKGDSYLSIVDKLSIVSKIIFEVYPKVFPLTPQSKSHLHPTKSRVSSYLQMVPRGGHRDFIHPLQAMFMYFLVTEWKLNLEYITVEYVCAVHTG